MACSESSSPSQTRLRRGVGGGGGAAFKTLPPHKKASSDAGVARGYFVGVKLFQTRSDGRKRVWDGADGSGDNRQSHDSPASPLTGHVPDQSSQRWRGENGWNGLRWESDD